MEQFEVVAIVQALWNERMEFVTAQEVAEELEVRLDQQVHRADVSRTLMRATRNGRLCRAPGHTEQGGWFRYAYAPTAKGQDWMRIVRARRRSAWLEDPARPPAEGPEGADHDPGEALAIACGDCDTEIADAEPSCPVCGEGFELCSVCDRVLTDAGCPARCG